jgi:hypothetical protein
MAHDVFLSHSEKDKAVADAVVARLDAESVTCWLAPRDVVPGSDWGESIINAIESSRIMILIFSHSANASPQVRREVERAVNKGVYIIPFRVHDIPPTRSLEYFISTSQWMDAFSPPLERHLDNLAKTVKAVLKSPPLPGATGPAQSESESPMTTPQLSHASLSAVPRSPPRMLPGKSIAVAIAGLMIVGGAAWYLGHKREVPPEKSSGPTQAERQVAIVNATEDEAASKQPEPTATRPQRKAAKDLTVLPVEDVARAKRAQPEAEAKEGFAASNSPTIVEPSIARPRGPWLFPDSSSRYLSATELSRLSSDDLWRARNEIFARNGYRFSTRIGRAFARTLGDYYHGVDDDQDRIFNNMNQYEQANVTLIRSIERGQ